MRVIHLNELDYFGCLENYRDLVRTAMVVKKDPETYEADITEDVSPLSLFPKEEKILYKIPESEESKAGHAHCRFLFGHDEEEDIWWVGLTYVSAENFTAIRSFPYLRICRITEDKEVEFTEQELQVFKDKITMGLDGTVALVPRQSGKRTMLMNSILGPGDHFPGRFNPEFPPLGEMIINDDPLDLVALFKDKRGDTEENREPITEPPKRLLSPIGIWVRDGMPFSGCNPRNLLEDWDHDYDRLLENGVDNAALSNIGVMVNTSKYSLFRNHGHKYIYFIFNDVLSLKHHIDHLTQVFNRSTEHLTPAELKMHREIIEDRIDKLIKEEDVIAWGGGDDPNDAMLIALAAHDARINGQQ